MGWIDIVGGCELDAYGARVKRPRYIDEADAEYRERLKQARSPTDTSGYGGLVFSEPGSAQCGGMTLRDYFAAKALMGVCAHPDTWGLTTQGIVRRSFEMADAMLAERAK